ncbi:LicD family protein [Butyrivibrio fibrisolvens]|uniref:LicD family protein n=1 Tax=Butyrivibrio fibrisolvens TaxID=831 RepID=UPI00042A6048|nr:LicD family protein [Butyrivibrio fibrisolvens]
MISIPDDFWKEECRNGFYVSEVMKKSWAVQLTLLDEILEIADRHDIKIWLDYGSLLGAVRHHGYIPWDDDIDTAVMRKDYLPLINYLKEELPPYRVVTSFYTDNLCDKPTTVISSRKNIDIGNSDEEKIITKNNYGFPCSSWVDIFPMDYVPDDPNMWNLIRNLYTAAYELAIDMDVLIAKGEFEDDLKELEALTHIKIKRDENIRNSIWKLSDEIASMTTSEESHYVGWYGGALHSGSNCQRQASLFNNIIRTDFEFIKAPIPKDYDSILKSEFGSTYMTPKRVYNGHDYPHFKNQERAILSCTRMGQLGDIF